MYGQNKRKEEKDYGHKKAKQLNKPIFTKDTTIEEKLDELAKFDFDKAEGSFGNTLIGFMNDVKMTEEELHGETGLSVRQISRIRKNKVKDIPLRTVVALCIGMRLEYSDSVILIGIAGYSLEKQSKDVQIYKAFLLEADISVEQCNMLLEKRHYIPLTGRKKLKGTGHIHV